MWMTMQLLLSFKEKNCLRWSVSISLIWFDFSVNCPASIYNEWLHLQTVLSFSMKTIINPKTHENEVTSLWWYLVIVVLWPISCGCYFFIYLMTEYKLVFFRRRLLLSQLLLINRSTLINHLQSPCLKAIL